MVILDKNLHPQDPDSQLNLSLNFPTSSSPVARNYVQNKLDKQKKSFNSKFMNSKLKHSYDSSYFNDSTYK